MKIINPPNTMAHDQEANTINRTLSDAMVTSMAECFALQQGVMHIPFYDGKNIPVRDFIQDIINGESSIPENCENQFVKVVLSKLKGAARDSTHGKKFDTIDELINHLKQRFAPRKSYSWYLHEISTIRMGRNEGVSEFYDRLTLLLGGARAALEEKYEADKIGNMIEPLNDCALEAFIRGLPDAISGMIEARDLKKIEDAFKAALQYESRHQHQVPNYSNNYHFSRYQQPSDYRMRNSDYEPRDRSPSPRVRFTPQEEQQRPRSQSPNPTGILKYPYNPQPSTSNYYPSFPQYPTHFNPHPYMPYNPYPYYPPSTRTDGHNPSSHGGARTPPRALSPALNNDKNLNLNQTRRTDATTSPEKQERQAQVMILQRQEESCKQK